MAGSPVSSIRQSNALNLEWSQVDLIRHVAWIHPDQAKAEHAIGVTLNYGAIKILEAQKGKHQKYVFIRNGKKLNQIDSAIWKKALQSAEITNFRWHDLRHTWASWLVQSGVPLMDLKEMGDGKH